MDHQQDDLSDIHFKAITDGLGFHQDSLESKWKRNQKASSFQKRPRSSLEEVPLPDVLSHEKRERGSSQFLSSDIFKKPLLAEEFKKDRFIEEGEKWQEAEKKDIVLGYLLDLGLIGPLATSTLLLLGGIVYHEAQSVKFILHFMGDNLLLVTLGMAGLFFCYAFFYFLFFYLGGRQTFGESFCKIHLSRSLSGAEIILYSTLRTLSLYLLGLPEFSGITQKIMGVSYQTLIEAKFEKQRLSVRNECQSQSILKS